MFTVVVLRVNLTCGYLVETKTLDTLAVILSHCLIKLVISFGKLVEVGVNLQVIGHNIFGSLGFPRCITFLEVSFNLLLIEFSSLFSLLDLIQKCGQLVLSNELGKALGVLQLRVIGVLKDVSTVTL